jgi:cation diffusion facilitator family transporter
MLAVAKQRSQMLVANAWHARSDAASSLVVIVGVVGNLLGYTFFDLLAAAVVGVMIAHMGGKLALEALAELIDTGLDAEEVKAIRDTLRNTPGVCGLHELRTRKMADNALVDAHIMVDPKISVSEGHYIAEQRVRPCLPHHVMDVDGSHRPGGRPQGETQRPLARSRRPAGTSLRLDLATHR